MKFIKVEVPDDFDPSLQEISYTDRTEHVKCSIWQPIYKDVLDKGFIGLIDFMGDDTAVVNAARVSYGVGTRQVSKNRGLIRYLLRHRHWTPVEMVVFKWHVRTPIFVARQWTRHRASSMNEYSGRYSIMTDDTYMPDIELLKPQSKANKQGRDGDLSHNNAYACQLQLQHIYQEASQAYHYLLGDTQVPSTALNTRYDIVKQFAMDRIKWLEENDAVWTSVLVTEEMIDEKIKEIVVANGLAFTDDEFWGEDGEGLSRELARIGLTLATYTEFYWKCDLRNIMNFISLRSDPHAQHEIRVYSDAMLKMIQPLVPECVQAFLDYQMNGKSLSSMELNAVKYLYKIAKLDNVGGWKIEQYVEEIMTEGGASKREVQEFLESIKHD